MIDEFLTVAGAFDWITPTVAFFQDFFNGPASDFGIPANAGWSRGEIKRLLKKYGVRVWGLMYNVSGDMLMFTVPKTQAKWAYYLLLREGVPILYAPADVINSSKNTNKNTGIPNPFEAVFNFLDKLEKDIDR